jgi:ribosomal protein L40E
MPETLPDLIRCPSCGASNPAGAGWCGQCHRRFGGPDAGERPDAGVQSDAIRPRPAIRKRDDALVWTCPACDAENPIDATACARCGSDFAAFFREPRPAFRSGVPSGTATILTALLPGLGHWVHRARRPAVLRGLLYLWSAGIAILLLARPPTAGRAIVRGVGIIFALSAAGVWLLSMLETMRLSEGDDRPVVPPRALTWFSAALSGVLFFGLLGAAIAGRG